MDDVQFSDDERVNYRDRYIGMDDDEYTDGFLQQRGLLETEERFQRGEIHGHIRHHDADEDMDDKTETGEDAGGDVAEDEEMTPPENFSPVCGLIYRSSFPRPENFGFLSKLKLKSILMLIPEEYPTENMEFVKKEGIRLFQVGMSGNKEPFVHLPDDVLSKALEIAIDPSNHPLLIHCNRGKHRTGCLVGCIRRLQNWSLTMIFEEYRRFAAPKARPLDLQFIEMYNEEQVSRIASRKGWLPLHW